MSWGSHIGIEYCDNCLGAIFEDEDGHLRYHTMGPLVLCSQRCVDQAKDHIRNGGTRFGV